LFVKDITSDYDPAKPETKKHKNIEKQKLYSSAARIGTQYFSVDIKIDVFKKDQSKEYKHHRVKDIDIPPALYNGLGLTPTPSDVAGAISSISLAILKDNVGPPGLKAAPSSPHPSGTSWRRPPASTPGKNGGTRLSTGTAGMWGSTTPSWNGGRATGTSR
jgi:hypothetical protein